MTDSTEAVADTRDWNDTTVTEHFEQLRYEQDSDGRHVWHVDVHPMHQGRIGARVAREVLEDFDEGAIVNKMAPGTYQFRLRRMGDRGYAAMRSVPITRAMRDEPSPTLASIPAPPSPPANPYGGDVMAAVLTTMMQGMQQQVQASNQMTTALLTKLLDREPEKKQADLFEQLMKLDQMLDRRADVRDKSASDEAFTSIAQTFAAAMQRSSQAAPAPKPAKPAPATQAAPAAEPAQLSGIALIRAIGGVLNGFASLGHESQDAIEGAADAVAGLLDSGGYSVDDFVGAFPAEVDAATADQFMPGVPVQFINAVMAELREGSEVDDADHPEVGADRDRSGGDAGGSGGGADPAGAANPQRASKSGNPAA